MGHRDTWHRRMSTGIVRLHAFTWQQRRHGVGEKDMHVVLSNNMKLNIANSWWNISRKPKNKLEKKLEAINQRLNSFIPFVTHYIPSFPKYRAVCPMPRPPGWAHVYINSVGHMTLLHGEWAPILKGTFPVALLRMTAIFQITDTSFTGRDVNANCGSTALAVVNNIFESRRGICEQDSFKNPQ
jgi:hypothetical protein